MVPSTSAANERAIRAVTKIPHLLGCLIGVGAIVVASPAGAGDRNAIQQCSATSEAGQLARRAGKYLEAQSAFRACLRPECPSVMQRDCDRWLAEIENQLPTIVVVAVRKGGTAVPAASVEIDGVLAQSRLTGAPIAVDPGDHALTVRFGEASGHQQIFVVAGEKNRVIHVELPEVAPLAVPTAPPVESEHRRAAPFPWTSAALFAAGIVTLGAGAVVGVDARGDLSDLERSPCATTQTCDPSKTDAIRTRFLVGDLLMGTGAVALGAAVWLFFRRPSASSPRTVTAAPTSGGAMLGWWTTL